MATASKKEQDRLREREIAKQIERQKSTDAGRLREREIAKQIERQKSTDAGRKKAGTTTKTTTKTAMGGKTGGSGTPSASSTGMAQTVTPSIASRLKDVGKTFFANAVNPARNMGTLGITPYTTGKYGTVNATAPLGTTEIMNPVSFGTQGSSGGTATGKSTGVNPMKTTPVNTVNDIKKTNVSWSKDKIDAGSAMKQEAQQRAGTQTTGNVNNVPATQREPDKPYIGEITNAEMERMAYLAGKPTLTEEEKKEAQQAVKKLGQVESAESRRFAGETGEGWWNYTQTEDGALLHYLSGVLASKSNWAVGMVAGMENAFPFGRQLADAAEQKSYDRMSEEQKALLEFQSQSGLAAEASPVNYGVGSVVGSVYQMIPVGNLANAIGKAATASGKLAPGVSKVVTPAVTSAVESGYLTARDLTQPGYPLENAGPDFVKNFGMFFVGNVHGGTVANATKNISGAKGSVARVAGQAGAGAVSSLAGDVMAYPFYTDENKPTKNEILTDALFGAGLFATGQAGRELGGRGNALATQPQRKYFKNAETAGELRGAYRTLATTAHPDMSKGDVKVFQEIGKGYQWMLKELSPQIVRQGTSAGKEAAAAQAASWIARLEGSGSPESKTMAALLRNTLDAAGVDVPTKGMTARDVERSFLDGSRQGGTDTELMAPYDGISKVTATYDDILREAGKAGSSKTHFGLRNAPGMEYVTPEGVKVPVGDGKTPAKEQGMTYIKVGTKDGMDVFESNFPPNTPKEVKQQRVIDLAQNVWAKNPIELTIMKNGKPVKITAQFNPELGTSEEFEAGKRTDLSKMAYGNRKGTNRMQRITLDLADDWPDIARNATHDFSKTETGKKTNPAHEGVSDWHYFNNDLIYRENGMDFPYTMKIDIKETADGQYFYSFGLDKQRK